jgi:hypothetical protein
VIRALHALELTGVGRPSDFRAALNAVFVDRREYQPLFDQAFQLFWRNPRLLDRALRLMMPAAKGRSEAPVPDITRRLAEAMSADSEPGEEREGEELELEADFTYSAREALQTKDFEDMSAEELAEARAALSRFRLTLETVPMRRHRLDRRGRGVDMRQTLRRSLRHGGSGIELQRRSRRRRRPPLVVLCDISGSMSQYSRMFLHFLHAITNDRDRVHTLLFGTRLSNVTRYLRERDVDEALDKAGKAVTDWGGGTRIGACLHEFNRHWARRLLGQGAVVLLVSDGLDRDAGEGIEPEIRRLHRSARRLIWLNPLLRFEGFEAKPAGIRALLPHVDEFRPVHNLRSLTELARVLSAEPADTVAA